jgi:hypothetical protein
LRARTLLAACAAALLLIVGPGCTVKTYHKGVSNIWRDGFLPPFEIGRTPQNEIMEFLGPPSQVIALKDQTIFYYMHERVKENKYYLGIYNWSTTKVRYDRAIFFFDGNGILADYAYSIESVPYEYGD